MEEMRRLNGLSDRTWTFLSCGLFAFLVLVVCSTFLHYGLTYDEVVGRVYGRHIIKWYLSFFKDQSALNYYNLYLYGGFFEAFAQLTAYIARRILPIDAYEARHLINALFGLLAIFYTYKLAAHLSGPSAGFFSALFLTFTPGFYGHIFNNSKDVPFAALFSAALYCIFRSYKELPRVSIRLTAELAVVIGLVLGIRIGGIILFGYLTIFWLCWLISRRVKEKLRGHELLTMAGTIGRSLIVIVIAAWAIMLVWWPWAQIAPLKRPYFAMTKTAHFDWPLTVLFNGRFVPASALPWTYLPTWLFITLPEFYCIALALGFYLAYKSLCSSGKEIHPSGWSTKIGLLVFASCFPILAALILHSTMYDGMRQFLFILPSLAALAGVFFAGFLKSGVHALLKGAIGIPVLLSVSLTIVDMIQLHPYEYVYFNRLFAGGMESAAKRFETDYWGGSYKEGVEWVINNYRPHSAEPVRVANCEVPFLIQYFFDKKSTGRFTVVAPNEEPSVYLAITRWQCHKMMEGKLLHIVQRKGAPLLYVIEAQGPYRPERSTKWANPDLVERN